MNRHTTLQASCLVLLACLLLCFSPSTSTADENHGASSSRSTYIVRVRPPPDYSTATARQQLEKWYRSFLPSSIYMSKARRRSPFIHTYSAAMLGFAANLTRDEAEHVRAKDGVLEVYRDILLPLLTTRTPDFLGLRRRDGDHQGAWSIAGMGEGVIIGVFDTGVDFAHTSFDDSGMHPPPARWRGSCNFADVRCNNKIIGARMFINGTGTASASASLAPVDRIGHGTHTASTAAGRFVEGASVLGSGNGTAAGMAPRAHLAIYQVCTHVGCYNSDMLAGMDAAITDGVDVMSLSLGGPSMAFYSNVMAVGAFSAMRKGIFVSCAAGNAGPRPGRLSNEAPWILTVGASTMDREMKATVKLGDGRSFVGESAYQPSSLPALPVVFPPDCRHLGDMAGKILACERLDSPERMGQRAKDHGAAGFILLGDGNSGHTTIASAHVLPASYLDGPDAKEVQNYIKSSNNNSTASIVFGGTSLGTTPAPVVAYFSSRGPSKASPCILKPDIVGPGVNVVAAWPFRVGPPQQQGAAAGTDFFDVDSGTSMSTPHLSGIAAIIKGAHPEWSPAAIKSAMMTTAYVVDDHNKPILDENMNPAGHFAIGAGHVSPLNAVDPGLVYDIDDTQYTLYLCGLGYTDEQVEIITHQKDACKKNSGKKMSESELNYPSLAVRSSTAGGKLVVNRTVTNVGDAVASYAVEIEMPKEVKVSVSPAKLEFSKLNEKATFTVSLSWDEKTTSHAEGSFKWVSANGKHVVRSPIVLFDF